jgi:hypothetical protein
MIGTAGNCIATPPPVATSKTRRWVLALRVRLGCAIENLPVRATTGGISRSGEADVAAVLPRFFSRGVLAAVFLRARTCSERGVVVLRRAIFFLCCKLQVRG